MKGPLHLFFQSAFQEKRENVINSPIVRDDAHSHAPRTNGSSYESQRRQRDCLTLINSRSSPHSSHLTIPSWAPPYPSPAKFKSKSKSSPTSVSRWDESQGSCTKSHVLSPPPCHPRRTSLDCRIEATKKSSQWKDVRPTTMDSLLTGRDSVSSLQSPQRPSRRYIKEDTMPGQPIFSSTSLKDVDVHRYHTKKKNNSLLSPSMPRRQGSFSKKKAGTMALPSPPIWSYSNHDEASPRHVAQFKDLEGILGKALEHCSAFSK
jgi:hypothetical protein